MLHQPVACSEKGSADRGNGFVRTGVFCARGHLKIEALLQHGIADDRAVKERQIYCASAAQKR